MVEQHTKDNTCLANPHKYEIGADEMSAILYCLKEISEHDKRNSERLTQLHDRLQKEFFEY